MTTKLPWPGLARALTVTALIGSAGVARADAGPKFPPEAFYINPGIVLGGTSSLDVGTGVHLGAEVSALYWNDMIYVGGVVDGLYDWKRELGRTMIGGMVGYSAIGIDGGYLMEYGPGGVKHGGTVRLFFSLGYVALYVRYGGIVGAPDFIDWGLLIKVPLPAWSVPRYPPPAPREPPETAEPPGSLPAQGPPPSSLPAQGPPPSSLPGAGPASRPR